MGYQLPGIGNVAFPGFITLGKQQTTESRWPRKGKDRGRHGSSSSSSSAAAGVGAGAAASKGKLLERGFLQRWRQELRPLLNSLRFVESSNRENCPDGDFGASIGPLQISRQYHHDAWKHTPAIAWPRCRDLNHAENTVIAYWLKYCPEAVERHDFETLAKIHNGGPQGPQREKTEYYWNKVSRHLNQQDATIKGRMKENVPCDFPLNQKHAKQQGPSQMYERSRPRLSPIATNTMPYKAQRRGSVNGPASCASTPKQQTPFMQSLMPKVFQRSPPAGGRAQEKESPAKLSRRSVKRFSTKVDQNKRLQQTSYFQSNAHLECVSLRHALHLGYWKLPRAYRREKAAVVIQAFWRMRCVRGQYLRMRTATVLIQKRWRRNFYVLASKQRIQLRKAQEDKGAGSPCSKAKCTPGFEGKQGDNIRPVGSPCELLYRGDISPNQEDALLTELVSLLKWDAENSPMESCHSFRFPHSEEIDEVCTPKMKPELRRHSAGSPPPHLSEERRAEEPSYTTLPCVESTPIVIKEALLSPFMEKEIIAELAKLFPPYMQVKSHEDVPAAHSLSIHEGPLAESSKAIENSEVSVSNEQSGKDGIIRRLTFGSTRDEGQHWGYNDEKYAFAMDVRFLEGHRKAGFMHSSPFSTSGDNCVAGSNCFCSKAESDEEELSQIDIPLLADQSPVLSFKTGRHRNQNPCNRKVEEALVSSLSEWQCSASFKEECQDQASRKGLKVDVSMDVPSLVACQALCTSKEFFLYSLTSPSSIQGKPSLQEARSVGKPAEEDDHASTQSLDILHSDRLLETSDVRNSTVYAKAFFQCMNFSLDEFEQGRDVADELGEKRKINGPFSRKGECGTKSHAGLGSLQHLCMLWEKHSVDLLTRSLKYKSLQGRNWDGQAHRQALQASSNVPVVDRIMDIDLEVQHLERLSKKFKDDIKERELVLHQRDIIYTNIAAYCDMQERHQLYNKWGIQKLLTGRLKKIIYELLWNDPQRYQESAELVIQYL